MDFGLAGKVAVVTGANRGIGLAIAESLAREGAKVLLVARDEERLRTAAKEIAGSTFARVEYLSLDLRRPEASLECMEAVRSKFGHLDILVNNAGDTKRGDFLELTDDDWERGFSLKVFGYVRMSRAAWPLLKETKGSIVNIIGSNARAGNAIFTIGGAANAALVNFTKSLADLGLKDGVRVNAINPGAIRTERLDSRIAYVSRTEGVTPEAAVEEILRQSRVTRFGTPAEIADSVVFLVSAQAAYIQGAILDIDGGLNRAV